MWSFNNEMFFTEYKLPTPSFKMPTDEIYSNDALLTYEQALKRWNAKIRTPEDALIRVVEWRRLVLKLQLYASNPFVAKSLKEALVYLANAEKKVEEMETPPRTKSAPEKPRGKTVPTTRWRDHWVPPMSW